MLLGGKIAGIVLRGGARCGGGRLGALGWARAEAGGGETHFDRGFAHAVKGVTTGFRGGTFFNQIVEDGCCGKDGEVHVVKGLGKGLEWRLA